MGIIGGLWDTATNAVKGATAPLVGLAKIGATGLETGGKVLGDVLTGQGGKAIDDLGAGFHQQVKNVVGVPETQWSALKGEVGGLGDTLGSSAKFVGEPIRGLLRIGANDLETTGASAGKALNGNFRGAASEFVHGTGRNFSIAGETASNEVHNLFW